MTRRLGTEFYQGRSIAELMKVIPERVMRLGGEAVIEAPPPTWDQQNFEHARIAAERLEADGIVRVVPEHEAIDRVTGLLVSLTERGKALAADRVGKRVASLGLEDYPDAPPMFGLGFTLYLDPGDASPEIVADVLRALSDLHRAAGGSGLRFEVTGETVLAVPETA